VSVSVVFVVETVLSLEALDVSAVDRVGVNEALAALTKARSWFDAKQAVLVRRLREIAEENSSVLPEADIAAATQGSRGDAYRATKRADALGAVPELEGALASGELSVGHVDVLARALQHLTPEQRALLAGQGARLALIAARSTPEQFARVVRHELIRLDARVGEERLARQRRNTWLRSWFDPDTGMWCLRGEFDPDTGLMLQGRLDNAVETMFHTSLPDTCPTGSGKQDHLRALALVRLIHARGMNGRGLNGRPDADRQSDVDVDVDVDVDRRFEVSVIIDLDTLLHGLHERSIIDNGSGADLPVESYRRMACSAAIIPTVLNSAGVVLDQGREIRLASRAQRRALRAMYDTCAIPGCTAKSKHCEPHHVVWWQHNGTTDLSNLLPLCSRHHHRVHEGGWVLTLGTDRSLTITYPDATVQNTGPPATQRAA
jgi:hypothetical protein